jgi:hypothetical protein
MNLRERLVRIQHAQLSTMLKILHIEAVSLEPFATRAPVKWCRNDHGRVTVA